MSATINYVSGGEHHMRVHSRKSIRKPILLISLTVLSLFFTFYSEATTFSALSGLSVCASSVIPSLFPFMVLSSMASKLASQLSEKSSERTAVILSVFLGALCGFPVGAAVLAEMHRNGAVSKQRAELLCPFCNNTGPSFVIGVIGRCFWGSTSVGIMLYFSQLVASAAVFTLFSILTHRHFSDAAPVKSACVSHLTASSPSSIDTLCRKFCDSVASSAVNVVQICGYVVFFKVICDMLRLLLPPGESGDIIYVLLASVLEFTSGAAAAASLGGAVGIALCGFTVGFSGVSVLAQSTGILSSAGLSSAPLIRLKLIIGLADTALSCIVYRLFITLPEPVFATAKPPHSLSPTVSIGLLSVAAVAFAFSRINGRRIGR